MRTALLLCLALGLSASAAPFRLTVLNPECCAGGAGLCVVMQTPEGRTYLYDTANGEPSGVELRNNGREIVVPWLLSHGIHASEADARLIRPKVAIAGIGDLPWMFGPYAKDKRCYEAVGADVYVSNRTGDITVETDGETFSVTTNPCALVRTREWAQMPGDVTLDGWVKNLEKYSKSRVARRWCEAETMERYARAETDVKVYLANGDAAALARARTVQSAAASDWLQVPPRSLPPFLVRPVLESDVTDAWLRLNLALLRATGENRYAQSIDALCRALRTQEVAPETLALLRTCALTLGQQAVFFNLYTDFSTGRLNVSAPWRFTPEISVKTDYPAGGRVTLALRHPAKDLRGAIPLKFMVPADRPVWKVTGLENVKHTAKVGADGYLAVSAAWPTDVTFTVEFQPASK